MGERTYKAMSRGGAFSLTVGIIMLVTGIVSGTLMIINGAVLLKRKNEITI